MRDVENLMFLSTLDLLCPRHALLYVGGVHWRCVTIYRSYDRHPILQVTHPTTCMWAVYIGGA
ncbi:hypothetical protein [Baaleninema simplex]|uniref:hypothetical protein n=1 Tax=Baaleninema simplex TaxID=2862350 RepID=UPI0011818995|nr:hypothetical protein [Baaleninema simplex]